MHAQYFDRSGRQLTKDEAFKDGILQDGVSCRTRLTMRDADYARHRPGFRSGDSGTFVDYLVRDDRRESYRDYENSLVNAYKKPARTADADGDEDADGDSDVVCLQCAGTGEVGNRTCPLCAGEGYLSAEDAASYSAKQNNDKRSVSVAQRMQDHKLRMDSIYDAVARDLEQEWKRKG